MKKIHSLLLVLSLVQLATAQRIPSSKKLLADMKLANQYFMNKWPDAGKSIFTNIERPSNIWTRAVYYEGLMALHTVLPDTAYIGYALQWGNKHKWGLRGGVQTRNADNQCCGQTYIDLYKLDQGKHPEWIRDIKASIDLMKASTKIDDWNWVDALQMAMPVYVRLGNLFNDTSYFNRMYDMYAFTKYKHGGKGLYNQEDKLWWRDKDFVPPYNEPNGEDCYWSRGNGWVVAALVRVLEELPASDPHYQEYLADYKDMMKALLPLQRQDGFWNVSLHDANHFGGKELSGTALFTYGMAWGLRNGHIDARQFYNPMVKAWKAMSKDALHSDGKLGFVQGTGKEPKDSQPVHFDSKPDFEDYGLGCFLLAGSELFKLKNK